MRLLKPFFLWLYAASDRVNRENILALIRRAGAETPGRKLLDLGCDDGAWTVTLGQAFGATELHGVELVVGQAAKAEGRGVHAHVLDLNQPLTALPDASFDLIHANQVIEHVTSVDGFLSEIHRLLRPGGRAVISTENGSSWHNVFAAALGWQIFSSTNVSARVAGLGNPFAIQRGGTPFTGTWTHKTIFNYRGLIELFEVHGFRDIAVAGAGYHPLWPWLGRIDVRHSAFITVSARK